VLCIEVNNQLLPVVCEYIDENGFIVDGVIPTNGENDTVE
jgi:hypothetical protein